MVERAKIEYSGSASKCAWQGNRGEGASIPVEGAPPRPQKFDEINEKKKGPLQLHR